MESNSRFSTEQEFRTACLSLVSKTMKDGRVDTNQAIAKLVDIADALGLITCMPIDESVQFTVNQHPDCLVPTPAAKAKVRMVCARFAQMIFEQTDQAVHYGGESDVLLDDKKLHVAFVNTPEKQSFTLSRDEEGGVEDEKVWS